MKDPAFERMVENAGPEKLADAMIRGITGLAELYRKAAEAENAKTAQPDAPENGQKTLETKETSGPGPVSIGKA